MAALLCGEGVGGSGGRSSCDLRRRLLVFIVAEFKMWREALIRYFEPTKIYYTKLFQELYVGIALTGYCYYKISYGGKKKVEDKHSSGHH
ncbi:UNVERIFIED_CONTAM: hypothetical protein K2H54_023737 [Gekko kuhli]